MNLHQLTCLALFQRMNWLLFFCRTILDTEPHLRISHFSIDKRNTCQKPLIGWERLSRTRAQNGHRWLTAGTGSSLWEFYSVRQRREISHMRIINTRDGYLAVWKVIVICVFNFFSKRQTSRHLRKKSKIMVQDQNIYRYKFRFSRPKVIQILILPPRMLIVNLRGVMEKIRNGEV